MPPRYSDRLVFWLSVVVPGAGFVLLGKPLRGLMYVVWMLFAGYLSWHYARPEVSLIGHLAGGLAVWMLSLVELARLLKRRRGQ